VTSLRPAGEEPTPFLEAIARLFRQETPEKALADGAHLIAALTQAPIAALFVTRGGEIVDTLWHDADDSRRAEFEPLFIEALRAASPPESSGGSIDIRPAPGGAFLVSRSGGDGDPAVVVALAWPTGQTPPADAPERASRLAEILGARVALSEWSTRFESQRVRYERWFRTLDHQLRLLDRERQKFSAVVHQSDIHVFVADVSGTIRWTNKAMGQLGPDGQPEVEWLGRTCRELCSGLRGREAAACSNCPLSRAVETNQPAHHELHAWRHGASRTLYMTALPIRGTDGLPNEVMVMLQDLTDLRVLRKSESRYRLLFERSANAIVMVEPQSQTLVLANSMTARMLGYAPDQLEGRALRDLFADEHGPDVDALFSSVSAAGPLDGFECRLLRRDGDDRIAVVSASRFDLDGEEVLLLEFLDVTERHRAEEALHEREQQLRQSQKMEAVGRLAGGIAHGFNNLLAVIMGRIGLIRDRLPADHPVRRDAEQIQNACVQGSWLTRHLLTFSRKEMSAPRVVDLRNVVSEMDGMLRCVLGEKIELVSTAGSASAPVLVDRAQIEQVLMNLVINARDALPNGGVITIELDHVHLDEDAARDTGAAASGSYLRLTVRDDGVGMDEETRARLFEPFFTTKEREKGSGLGMSIVYGTVTQAGGHLQVSSEVGLGTTVDVYLPRALEDAVAEIPAAPRPETPGGEIVLVVEDDEPVRAVTCEALEMEGYTVLSAASGPEALELVDEHRGRLDLMVTDVVMPGMSGGELARRLAVVRPETKVIFVSGYVDDAIVRDGVMAEGVPFLQKPYPLEALALLAREVLDGAGSDASRAMDQTFME
jgi:PAS domain S-box-containing protein